MMRRKNSFRRGVKMFRQRLWRLVSQPIFIALTCFGNTMILSGAAALLYVEKGINPVVRDFVDTLWWSVSTVTTVGYGDVTPITHAGRFIGIVLMIVGSALFWSYTALFAEALISKDILDLEDELHAFEEILNRISHDKSVDRLEVQSSLKILNEKLATLLTAHSPK